MDFNRYKYSSMVVTDYNFTVPLDYHQKEGRKISIFAREILNEKHEGNHKLSLLCCITGLKYG